MPIWSQKSRLKSFEIYTVGFETPIRIDQTLPAELQALCLTDKGWCYITAWNPRSQHQ